MWSATCDHCRRAAAHLYGSEPDTIEAITSLGWRTSTRGRTVLCPSCGTALEVPDKVITNMQIIMVAIREWLGTLKEPNALMASELVREHWDEFPDYFQSEIKAMVAVAGLGDDSEERLRWLGWFPDSLDGLD